MNSDIEDPWLKMTPWAQIGILELLDSKICGLRSLSRNFSDSSEIDTAIKRMEDSRDHLKALMRAQANKPMELDLDEGTWTVGERNG